MSCDNFVSLYKKFGNDIPRDWTRDQVPVPVVMTTNQPVKIQEIAKTAVASTPEQIIEKPKPKVSDRRDKPVDFINKNIQKFPTRPDVENPRQRRPSDNTEPVYLYGGQV